MTDLKPCPFCGGEAVTRHVHRMGWNAQCIVRNTECHVNLRTHYGDTEDEAIAAWNRRAPGWRPIESAPKDRVILVAGVHGDFAFVRHNPMCGLWCPAGAWAEESADGFLGEFSNFPFTHWMPKPEDPKEGE